MDIVKELKNQLHFNLVNTDESLVKVCQQAQDKNIVALDTEFIRTRTYYPQLGLIQLYDGENVSLIDPVGINDFSPLISLLANQHVLKVLHACYEDLVIFQHYFHQLPSPIMDTQIMAGFLGFPNSTGLTTLIQHYFLLEIDKGASRTDWLARPLSNKQLQYATADVWYLLPLYKQMQIELDKTDWGNAAKFDSEILLEKCLGLEIKDAEKGYLNIPNAWQLNPLELMRLKLLAKWRQKEAIKRDLALNFVIKGEILWLIAKNNPKYISDLLKLGLTSKEVKIYGKQLLQLIEEVKYFTEKDYPPPIYKISDDPRYKKTIKLLQEKLRQLTPADLSVNVISSKRGLENLMKWVWVKQKDPNNLPDLVKGWRQEFGIELMKILDT